MKMTLSTLFRVAGSTRAAIVAGSVVRCAKRCTRGCGGQQMALEVGREARRKEGGQERAKSPERVLGPACRKQYSNKVLEIQMACCVCTAGASVNGRGPADAKPRPLSAAASQRRASGDPCLGT